MDKSKMELAKVGDRSIRVEDFESRFRPQVFSTEEEERDKKMDILNKIIEEKLFAIAGEKEGLAEGVDEALKDYPDRLAVNQLYKEVVVKNSDVSLSELRTTYRKMGRELHARHIVMDTEEKAKNVYEKLIKNDAKNFPELASKSIDTRTKDKAGDMGWVSWGRMDPELQKVAYDLDKGKISKPFKTQMGWDILQIVDEREKKLQPFEQEKDKIENMLKRKKMSEIAQNYLDKLKERANINYNTATLSMIVSKSGGSKPISPYQPAPLPVLTEEESKKVVVSSNLGEMTAAELLKKAEETPRRPPFSNVDMIKRFVEAQIMNDLLLKQAERMHLHKSPEVKREYKKMRDSRIAADYRKEHLVIDEDISEEKMKKYYVDNREDYKIKEKRTLGLVVVKTEKEADEVYKSLKRGGNLKKIAEKKSTHYTSKRGGKLGPFTNARFPKEYKSVTFRLKKGEISKPFKTKDGYAVGKLLEIEPESYYEFDKVKNRIQNEIKNQERQEKLESLVTELKKDIPVEINEKLLMEIGKKQEERK